MAVAYTVLTQGRDSTDAVSYSTAAVAPGANRLATVTVFSSKATTPDIPTISGGGVTTWVQIDTVLRGTASRITTFRGMTASPGGAAAIVISFGAGNTQTSCSWAVEEATGIDTTGTNGSGAIVQAVNNNGAAALSGSVTLAAFGSANNATWGAFYHQANEASTAGTGFTKLADQAGSAPNTALATEWQAGNDTTVDMSWATSIQWAAVAMEIKAAATTTPFSGWGVEM